jgi:hypothetical protein
MDSRPIDDRPSRRERSGTTLTRTDLGELAMKMQVATIRPHALEASALRDLYAKKPHGEARREAR